MKEETFIDIREGKPSASGMQRLVLCPGSYLAEQAYPEESNAAAEAGTRLHKHMEDGTLPSDPDENEAVLWCRNLEIELCLALFGRELTTEKREQRLWDRDHVFSGQADVCFFGSDTGKALVLDYKFGRTQVPVSGNNMQLAALALLLFDNYEGMQEVYAGILQPFASRSQTSLVKYTSAEVSQLRAYLHNAVTKAMSKGATRIPGEEQCRYCKARAACPACTSMVQGSVSTELAEWADWAPEKKADALRLAGMAKKWAEAVERKAKADLKEGFDIPGYKLGAGRKSFKVTDATGAFTKLNALIGVTGEEFAGCCSVSISALDKVVHKRLSEQAPEGTKQLVKKSAEWLRATLADFGSESVSEGTIKESNK